MSAIKHTCGRDFSRHCRGVPPGECELFGTLCPNQPFGRTGILLRRVGVHRQGVGLRNRWPNGFIDLDDSRPGFGLTLHPADANFRVVRQIL